MKFALLMPTYNEIDGMKAVMPQIDRGWVDEILVVDGGSTDGTVEYARQIGLPVYVQQKRGIRYAYIEGLDKVKSDIVITFSPDGNSLANQIPALVSKMREGFDMVIVSRYLGEAKSYDDDFVTGFGNKMFTWLINSLYAAKYTDAMVMYRAWKKQLFYDLDLHKDSTYAVEERLFRTVVGCEPLLSVRAAKAKLKCSEIPGDEPARIGGARKLQIFRWGMAYIFEILRDRISK